MLKSSEKGAIAEMATAAAAVKLGVFVCLPLQEGRRYDLLFDIEHRLMRVQCKWGRLAGDVISVRTSTSRHTPRGYVRTTYSADEIDLIAVYCDQLNRCFLLPIDEVAGISYVHLRLARAGCCERAPDGGGRTRFPRPHRSAEESTG